nr:proline racemase family protein [Ruegeria marina]
MPGAFRGTAGEKAIDRPDCGTGTSARIAQLAARGELRPDDDVVHEFVIRSLYHDRVEALAEVAGRPGIIPSIGGWARITGFNTIFIDACDHYAHGCVVA